ncbi:DUF6549 family protein [Aquimarina sp. 2-A2]|uniref:DUF6549 family protein n=1 Tax=Aquimarina sp. 2-A2 TaxID=3382644 RepID=UPI00387F364F
MIDYVKKNWYWIFAVSVLVFLLIQSNNKNIDQGLRHANNLLAIQDTVKYYKNKEGDLVASKRALEVTNKELKEGLYIKDQKLIDLSKKFDKVHSATIIQTETIIDSVTVPHETKVPFDFERKFILNTEDYSIAGWSNQDENGIEKISVPAKLRVVTGIKNRWTKSHYTTDIVSDNPHVKIKDIDSQVITVRNKRFGVGFIAGIDIKGEGIIGFGVSYDLFKF